MLTQELTDSLERFVAPQLRCNSASSSGQQKSVARPQSGIPAKVSFLYESVRGMLIFVHRDARHAAMSAMESSLAPRSGVGCPCVSHTGRTRQRLALNLLVGLA